MNDTAHQTEFSVDVTTVAMWECPECHESNNDRGSIYIGELVQCMECECEFVVEQVTQD